MSQRGAILQKMGKKRGTSHTTLTETAAEVVKELRAFSGIKMIAPGIIDSRRSGPRHITAVYTNAGLEFIISGQGVQKIAVHLPSTISSHDLVLQLKSLRTLKHFKWNEREKKPGR